MKDIFKMIKKLSRVEKDILRINLPHMPPGYLGPDEQLKEYNKLVNFGYLKTWQAKDPEFMDPEEVLTWYETTPKGAKLLKNKGK